jgi:stage III sporulation protein AD
MDQIFPIAAVALIGSLSALFLKREVKELSLLLSIVTSVILLSLVTAGALEILSLLRQLAETAEISDALLAPMLKVLGIEVVTNLVANICRDAGEGGVASAVELTGAICALYTSIPVIQAVLILIEELL